MEEEPIKTYSFKAGIMNFNDDTKLVSADKRKGIVTASKYESGETKFIWQENLETPEEYEVYVFPQCGKIELSKQRSRVLILFNQDDPSNPEPIQFFWIQEKKVEKDQIIVSEINNMINEMIEEEMEEDFEEVADEQVGLLQQQQPQQQLQQPSQSQQQQGGNNDFLQQMMQQMQQMSQQGGMNPNMLQQMMQQQQKKESPYLSRIFTPEFLEEIAQDKEFQEVLIGELPEGQKGLEHLLDNLKSAQFQQALESLDKALNSEGGPSVLMSMGLGSEAFQNTIDGNEALYNALQKWAEKNNEQKE